MLRPISGCACFSAFLAYFSFLFSFLVVAAASAEDSICVPLPGALPPLGTLPSGTPKKSCCHDERPSGVRIRPLLAWVSGSPEGYEKLYLLGDGFSIFSYSASLVRQ